MLIEHLSLTKVTSAILAAAGAPQSMLTRLPNTLSKPTSKAMTLTVLAWFRLMSKACWISMWTLMVTHR